MNKVLTENTDFLVVGVIGLEGVGKSTILNNIAHHLRRQTTPASSANSTINSDKENKVNNTNLTGNSAQNSAKSEVGKDVRTTTKDNDKSSSNNRSKNDDTDDAAEAMDEVFRVQSFEKQMLSEHCTSGIKAWISPTTRVIFLDSQPLNSCSVLDRAMQMDKKHLVPEYVGTMEATVEIQSLQIVGFLSMVSHREGFHKIGQIHLLPTPHYIHE